MLGYSATVPVKVAYPSGIPHYKRAVFPLTIYRVI